MTVCKFFQQGYCRYGQNCRFEHIYGSKYSYHAPTTPTQVQPTQNTNAVTDEQLVNQVQCDVQAALKGGQWIISCYAPFKEKPIYPGLADLSPEEARLFMYEAKANNNVNQAVAYMDNLFKESRHKYEQLLQPNPNTINVLRSLYNGEPVSLPMAQNSTFGTVNNASSIFRSAVNNTNISVFNTNPNVFAQSSDSGAAKSIFAQANQANFGQSSPMFPNQNETSKSLFAQENQKLFDQTSANNPPNIFASSSQSIFSKSEAFPQSNTVFPTQPPGNIFQSAFQTDTIQSVEPQSVFGVTNNVFEQSSSVNDDVYSKVEDLSPDDLEAFKSDEFKLGFIPEVPPPQSLCI